MVKRMALQKSDGGSTPFNQQIVASLMRSNKMGLHIVEVSQHIKAYRDAMIDALAKALPGAMVRKPEGGYFLWVELPEGMSGDALAARSIVHGVEVSSGRVCFPTAAAENYLCLAYI